MKMIIVIISNFGQFLFDAVMVLPKYMFGVK